VFESFDLEKFHSIYLIIFLQLKESTFPEGSDPSKLPEKQQVEAEKKLLVSFSRILSAFLAKHLDLQLIAIYALQVFCFQQQFPKGKIVIYFLLNI
jgi:translation initiation factor 4G